MSKYTKEDIMKIIEEEDVEFIRLQFPDVFGTLKNIAITTSQLERALNNRIMFDGSSINGFVNIEASDMFLVPDLDTFAIFPWRPQNGKVARFMCNICYPDGTPFEGDSRYILQKVIGSAAGRGYKFLVGPECEFFLFHLDDNGQPTLVTHENAGYFDVSPYDLGENARRDMILTMEQMNYMVDSSHHEFASAQHEIDLHYDEALHSADEIMTFRLAARTIAQRHGLYATFMPKPKNNQHGSGMHMNFSIVRDGINIFEDEKDPNGLSQTGYYFIGGLMKHIRGMTCVLNPLVNSYKRLDSGYEAPRYIAWSATNRSMLIRVPAEKGFNTRVELRSPDSAANPYLTLALCLAAGMDGIDHKIMPPASVDMNMETLGTSLGEKLQVEQLPSSLYEAIRDLKADPFIWDVLGGHITEKFIEEKTEEWNSYAMHVSDWEIDSYLSKF